MCRLTTKLIKEIEEKTPCGVTEYERYYSIWVDNSCGEDFSFEVEKGESEVEDIISYCDDFDYCEHFKLWFGANNGEPDNPEILLENCKEIASNLEELADLLR